MARAGFYLQDKLGRTQFLKKNFWLADISIEMVLRMSFLSFSLCGYKFAKNLFGGVI